MTRMQVEAQKLGETIRSNKVNEELTRLRDAANQEYQRSSIELGNRNAAETERANREKERYNILALNETQRANIAREAYEMSSLNEQKRHSMAQEDIARESNSISLSRALEEQRANKAREMENVRSAKARETQNYLDYLEQGRSNRARESFNLLSLDETRRSNISNEAIRTEANWINLQSMNESVRSHKANEEITRAYNSAQNALKIKELEDRYFWSDKANQALEAIFGSNDINTIGGKVNEKVNEGIATVQGWYNDRENRGETKWKTEVEIPLRSWVETEVAPKVDKWASSVREKLGIK